MNRTSTTGVLLSMLGAAAGCGDEDFVCQLNQCGTGCVNIMEDVLHCGSCFNACDTGESCMAGACMATDLVCTAPEVVCGDECANTQTSNEHCGTCDAPCSANGACASGVCAEPLIALRTVFESKGDIARDVFVVRGVTLEVTRLGTTSFKGDRVLDHAILPDGRVLLIGSPADGSGVAELWMSSPGGGELTKLSGALVLGGEVLPEVAISADGTKVLYRADQDVDDQFDLYAVSVANPGATVKVNGALVSGGRVSRVFSLSSDGTRATYIADEDEPGIDELYTVDLSAATPGPSVKLNPSLSKTNADVFDFTATADHARVLYRCDDTLNGTPQLFVADVATAGTVKRIDNPLESNYRSTEDYSLIADGASAIYTGADDFFSDAMFVSDLAVASPTSVLLAENALGFENQIRSGKAVAGGAVFFRQDIDFFVTRMFTVDLASPNVVNAVYATELGLTADRIVVSNNGQHLVFGSGGDGGESGNELRGTDGPNTFGRSFELYHVDLSAPLPQTPTRIVSLQGASRGIEHDYIVRDDGSVIFRADLEQPFTTEVFIAHPLVPGAALRLGPALDATTDANSVAQLKSF